MSLLSDRVPMYGPTNFMLVAHMNNAFGNAKGFTTSIDWNRVAKQSLNVANELAELFIGLGADKKEVKAAAEHFKTELENLRQAGLSKGNRVDINTVRDAAVDINVFSYGVHHFMGVDADADFTAVISGVLTRFIKDEADKQATIKLHADAGVTDVYFEGEFPTMIMKSASDQPDAPKGKFLKSASYTEPVFYEI